MSEQAEATNGKAAKKVSEVFPIQMNDGRTVNFVGNRKMDKNILIDETKLTYGDDGSVLLTQGAIGVQIDFKSGESVTCFPPVSMLVKGAGHGLSQKLGDEAANEKDVDDAYEAIRELGVRLEAGEWGVTRESGGFSGASVVIRAIMEATGKTQEDVRAFLQKKLDDAKGRGETLTRASLYAAFRNPNSKTGQIIKRLEDEKASKASAIDADAALEEMGGAAA